MPNTSEQNLNENGAGITTIMNIGYVPLPLQPVSCFLCSKSLT